jgi:hypothetical protein
MIMHDYNKSGRLSVAEGIAALGKKGNDGQFRAFLSRITPFPDCWVHSSTLASFGSDEPNRFAFLS